MSKRRRLSDLQPLVEVTPETTVDTPAEPPAPTVIKERGASVLRVTLLNPAVSIAIPIRQDSTQRRHLRRDILTIEVEDSDDLRRLERRGIVAVEVM